MKKSIKTIGLLLSIFLIQNAHADLKTYTAEQWDSKYLDLTGSQTLFVHENWRQQISLPPPPGLKVTIQEIEKLHLLKSFREKHEREITEEIQDIKPRFLRVINKNKNDTPALNTLLKNVIEDTTIITMHFKEFYSRARPWTYDASIKPSIAPPGHPAYPSGHATQSHTVAQILSLLFPEKTLELDKTAYQVAKNREIGGVHYQSDTDAGLLLSRQIVAMMLMNADFQLALKAAEQEKKLK